MGTSSSQNKKEELNFIDSFSIIDQQKVKAGDNLTLTNSDILNEKAKKSICIIIKDNGYGTGFFCKIKYPNNLNEIYCLITNNHIITKDMLINKENIEIKLNIKKIKISLNSERRFWSNEEIDFTCIEILKEDNIIEIINPFEIDENCYNLNYNIEEYDQRGIVIPSMGIVNEIEFSQGAIYLIKSEKHKNFFFHDCNTEPGFSGGPIILINNIKIIGIHKGYEKKEK